MPELKTYDLFISHAWRHNAEYYRLIDLLDAAKYFTWRNYSVPEHDPAVDPDSEAGRKVLTDALDRQIRQVNCVLVIAGMYDAAYKYWIQMEIELAQRYNKPIIGLIPKGAERTPLVVQKAAKEMVGWTTDLIVRAVRKHSI